MKIFSPTATYYECGICGALHAVQWNGDCREDDARLDPKEIDTAHGPHGWVEVEMPTWENTT